MAVRRLHPEQPSSFAFTPESLAWAKAQLAKYPEGRQASAVVPLLWRAQEQEGWLSEPAIRAVADMLGMAYIRVYEIATFYTMFQLSPVGRKAHVQVCGTTPCMLRGSLDLMRVCKQRIAGHPHEVSEDGGFSWEEVECLGSCANAPMVQIGADTFEDLTPELLNRVLDAFEKGRPAKPGSQIGRTSSCPASGATTLADYRPKETRARGAEDTTAPVAFGVLKPESAGARSPREDQAGEGGFVGSGLVTSHVVVGEESVGDMQRPRVLTAPRDGKADDLKLIQGIGPVLEAMLNKLGIWHFDQIASWSIQNMKWIDQQLEDFRGRAERDRWVEQARRLASGARSGRGGRP
jgi:NADH-quinone oxidoreductase subunit E